MRKHKTARIRTVLAAVIAAVSIAAAGIALSLTAGAEATQQYEKRTTYVADLENGIDLSDSNWDLLYDARIADGKLSGTAQSESGYYGIGFRRRTTGRGTTVISADVKIPEAANNKNGFLEFGLRLGDYTDNKIEKKGIRVCVEGGGKIGIIASLGKVISCQKTEYTFTEGRRIYIEDNADTNVITVFVDDGGQKVRVAECTVLGKVATMEYADAGLEAVTVEYDHEIQRAGYIALNTDEKQLEISALSVTVPSFSPVPYAVSEETVVGGGTIADDGQGGQDDWSGQTGVNVKEDPGRFGDFNAMLIVYPVIALLLASVIVFSAVKLAKRR